MKFWRSSKIKVLDKHYNENPLQKSGLDGFCEETAGYGV